MSTQHFEKTFRLLFLVKRFVSIYDLFEDNQRSTWIIAKMLSSEMNIIKQNIVFIL